MREDFAHPRAERAAVARAVVAGGERERGPAIDAEPAGIDLGQPLDVAADLEYRVRERMAHRPQPFVHHGADEKPGGHAVAGKGRVHGRAQAGAMPKLRATRNADFSPSSWNP